MTTLDQSDEAAANEVKTRRFYEAMWNERQMELVDEWVSPDFVGYYSAYPEPVRGREGFRRFVEELFTAIPDLTMTIQDTIAAGDKVVSRVRLTGTHTGVMQGFAPTGQRIDVEYIAIERYRDGACVEEWVQSDDLRLSRQIGALPNPGSVGERVSKMLHRLAAARMRRRRA